MVGEREIPEAPSDEVRRRMNRRGRRMTPQREAILAVLAARRDHPSAEEIHAAVQQRIPRISLGTVYRNLQVLVEGGFTARFPARDGSQRFDGDVTDHHHVVCRECRGIDDVYFDLDPRLLRRIAKESGFRVLSHRVEFDGICADCSRASGRR